MNTKWLMTAASVFPGVLGIFAIFAPDVLLTTLGVSPARPSLVLIQLMGSLYFAFALVNWTAKDSAIGGIYARPVSLGNFAHFLVGTLTLIRYFLSADFNWIVFLVMVIYTGFAVLFYWLVFWATGLPREK